MSPLHRFLLCPARFIVLVFKAFLKDAGFLHASALTYITLLAIVPVFALAMTSFRAFGGGDALQATLFDKLDIVAHEAPADPVATPPAPTPQPTPTEALPATTEDTAPTTPPAVEPPPATTNASTPPSKDVTSTVRRLLTNVIDQVNRVNFKALGTIGAVCLLFMVISVIGKIEDSFNVIWAAPRARSFWRKITDYLCVIIFVPFLAISASSLPILTLLQAYVPGASWVLNTLGFLNFIIPLALLTLLFTFIFCFIPNARVRFISALFGGFITVLLLQLFFNLCWGLQLGVANASSIYGSLVALPILLLWINFSWLIILFGAKLCYVFQYRKELLRESAFTHPSERDTITLAIALTLWAADHIDNDNRPMLVEDVADLFKLPTREVLRVAEILCRSKILLPIAENRAHIPTAYVLSCNSTRLTVADIVNACLDNTEGEDVLREVDPSHGPYASVEHLRSEFSHMLNQRFSITVMDALAYQRAKHNGDALNVQQTPPPPTPPAQKTNHA